MEGASLAARAALLRELLTESNAFGFLLGGAGREFILPCVLLY